MTPALDRSLSSSDEGLQTPESLHLPTPLLVDTLRRCLDCYPREACGLLLGRRSTTGVYVRRAVRCTNTLPPEGQLGGFSLDPLELLACEDDSGSGEQLVGIYHSHCDTNASPSSADHAAARNWPDLLWLIVAIDDGTPTDYSAWWPGKTGLSRLPLTQPPTPSMLLSVAS